MRIAYVSSLLTAALLAGCAAEGYKTAEKANSSLTNTKTELITDKAQLKTTVDTLNDLVYHPATDMRPQYMLFSKAVDDLDRSAAATKKSTADTIAMRADYLAQWRTETMENTDKDLRDRAMDRIEETRKRYDAVNDKLADVNNAFDPLLVDLKAIRDYISTDLTSNGIKSISDRATNAKNRSITVNKSIDDAVIEIDGMNREASPMPATMKSDTHDMNKM